MCTLNTLLLYRLHSFHPYYYMINGINKDGFAYVLYINGGHQQWMILYPFKQKILFIFK